MAKENRCPECNAKLPADAPENLCPRCLLKAGGAKDINATIDRSPLIEGPGTKIGRYELLELIGEGGMGLVYLAQQKKPVKRRVALKIIKPGMDSKQVIARFEAERQALAMLDHPNIAHVFDAGTTRAGLPYFVMEYVKGMSITAYCDEHKLDIEQRLKLFEHVCEGIHHAHQKGIIHRDIKPSNILVSMHGDRTVPKLIDFGIAKATARSLTDKTVFTCQGQLLGTPEYMSPEQVDLSIQDIDTRSDIYSLGVVLYELLAGVLPFERESLAHLGFAEVQRTIREQEPDSPSIRLTNLGEQAKTIATSRGTQAIVLARRLHRELEWVPLKAMRKDRCRRYRSASEMADDIQNYLNGSPLIAGPETTVYRVQKFVHKHAGSVVTVALVAVAIILGLIISTAMYFRSEKALEREAVARVQAEDAKDKETVARTRAEQAEEVAQEQRELAEERTEDYRRSLYVSRIALADVACRNNNIHRLHELLDSCPEDLRGWEWYRLNHTSDQATITLKGHTAQVFQAEISPDGKRIVSGCNDGTITIWDIATSTELITFRGHEGGINAVSFSPDGKRIVSGGGDNISKHIIKVWDAATGEELMTVGEHDGWIWSVAFSANSEYIVSSSSDTTIKIWDASSGVELKTLRGHEGRVLSATLSPNSKLIVSSSDDKTVKVWDVASGSELITLRGHNDAVGGVAFSPDGKRIASGSEDKTIKVWDAATGAELMTLRGHADKVGPVSFSPDGSKIISGSVDNTVKVWDVSTGVEIRSLRGHGDWLWSVGFSPDGRHVISSGWDKTIKIWDWAMEHDRIHLGRSHSVAFSPDGKNIATTDWNVIRVWDAATSTEVMNLRGHHHVITSVVFDPDSKCIISSSWDGTIKVWDTATGSEQLTINCDQCVNYASISADGKRIVSACWDGTICIWDRNTGDELMTIDAYSDNVRSVEFSPNGKRIVSCGKDGTIKVSDAETGEELIAFSQQDLEVEHITFSPDGRHIMECIHG